MPLVAEVDGARVVSIDLDDDAWDALRLRSRGGALRFPACASAAYLRTSRRGLRHFAHAPGAGGCGAHGDESAAHMQAKALIIAAARAAGWQAEPEVPGPGYQADVLTTSPTGVRLNFEVQLAREEDTDYRTRSLRRTADGCRVLWLTRYPLPPRGDWEPDPLAVPDPRAPQARLVETEGQQFSVLLDRMCSLEEAVTDLLSGRIVLRAQISGERVLRVVLARRACWSCSARISLWRVVGEHTVGACGRWADADAVRLVEHAHAETKREQAQDIRAAVAARIKDLRWPAMAGLSSRASEEAGKTYMAFSCWQCGRVQGDHYLSQVWVEAAYNPDQPEVLVSRGASAVEVPHWCRPPEGATPCRSLPSPAPPSSRTDEDGIR
ncbi:hypothetical protein [Cellulomonas biazotea]|uniref:Competence protein CoiA n=1 Tax=Cellulomonas biazotea TaxID=1709 RepID=A0A402DNG0_9CELL|nr:hypothetical protein [Cellulomonas biazotea]GCE75665.1 hypothetical protein CBZ_07210 [Cellulomonas biazotea]